MSPYLFELEAPRSSARRGRPAAATTNPSPVDCSSMAGSVAVGAPAVAGPSPTPGPWVLEIPAPTTNKRDKKTRQMRPVPGWLSMNDRWHRRKEAALVAEWRKAATLLARRNKLPVGVVMRARFDVVLRFTATVRRDPSNWHPTVKPILDALTRGTRTHPGYGFLPDDSPQFLHCEDCPHLRIDKTRLPKTAFGPLGLLVLTVTALDVSEVAA